MYAVVYTFIHINQPQIKYILYFYTKIQGIVDI